MTKRITIIALLLAFAATESSAQNHTHRRRGAIFGGLAGAALGAVIGDKGDNETAGALIGGAVGAVAGGTIGNQKDQRIEHNYRYHSGHSRYAYPQSRYQHRSYPQNQPSYYQPHVRAYPQPAPPVAPANRASRHVSTQDVVAMVRSGLSESVIIDQIKLRGIDHQLTVAEVIQLHEMGVSEPIITKMQLMAPIESVNETLPENTKEVLPVPGQSYRLPPPPVEPYGKSVVAPSNER